MSEELIVKHCSPTLAGMKTGNLFTCAYETETEVRTAVRRLNRLLVPKGLRVLPMRYSKQRALIYIYRPEKLKSDLEDYRACKLLRERGYTCGNPERCIVQLIYKFYIRKVVQRYEQNCSSLLEWNRKYGSNGFSCCRGGEGKRRGGIITDFSRF